MNQLNEIKLRRDVLPNIVLLWLAKDSLHRAEIAEGRHQRYLCVASITFAALALEAFLNVIGASLTNRTPNTGDSVHIPSSFTRLIFFLAGRRSAARPSAGNANR